MYQSELEGGEGLNCVWYGGEGGCGTLMDYPHGTRPASPSEKIPPGKAPPTCTPY